MKPLSIRSRVTTWFVTLTALLLIAFSATLFVAIRRESLEGLDAKLLATAEGFASICEWEEDLGVVEFELGDELAAQLSASSPGRSVEVWTWPAGELLHRSGRVLEAPISESAGSSGADAMPPLLDYRTLQPEDGPPLRLCTALIHIPARAAAGDEPSKQPFSVLVRVAENLDPLNRTLAGIGWVLCLLAASALLAAVGFGLFLSRKVVQPLRALGTAASKVGSRKETLMPRRGSNDEVDQLAEILDGSFRSLEKAIEEQARFTANASHELHNPISIIRNAAEVALRKEREPQQYRELFRDVHVTAKRMGVIVEALLLLARVDVGTAEVSFEEVDLSDVVSTAVDEIETDGDERRIAFEANGPALVRGDRRLLRILLDNLLSNAIAHSNPGSAIEVALAEESAQDLVLSVCNDGPGIPQDERERVFDRFHRLEENGRKTSGAGLGLSIVSAIAGLHSARCRIEDQPPSTCFRIVFMQASR